MLGPYKWSSGNFSVLFVVLSNLMHLPSVPSVSACTATNCNMRVDGWKAPRDTNKFLASLSVERATLVSTDTFLGLERAGITCRMQIMFSGLWRTEPA